MDLAVRPNRSLLSRKVAGGEETLRDRTVGPKAQKPKDVPG